MKLAVVVATVALTASSACSQSSPPVTPTPAVAAVVSDDSSDDSPATETVTLDGTLFVDEAFTHPNGTKPRPYILRLDAPHDGASEVHVGPVEGLELRPWVGRHVRVEGTAMPAMTAWHARPLVVLASRARPAL